ncbi:ABC transporter permease [Desulfolutivibrio sulfoxidireducens]|uniref:ABC transporter permease n=1 Tax=Desulfolutivibrio sulfoxidireducens TaxID=2773299 RepID=UPI00159D86CA|nr:ABC transporter permease [Desulfolutivibrio sulfoxidireducens]QLA19857.1 FtsX-like permease family protein [Desulfolutivibrio sulfoxidireducens]
MRNIFKIALRNMTRYKRRTILTSMLIILGVTMVVLFSGLAGSVKSMMIGIITDSNLGHLQIHKRGYVSSIDTLPLNLNMNGEAYQNAAAVLDRDPGIESHAPRLKLGAVLSNFAESTNVRLTAVDPAKEPVVCPGLASRLLGASEAIQGPLLEQGQIIIPQKVANGIGIKPGDTVVLVATNRDGSVNGMQFTVSRLIEDIMGPSGKDAYMHIDDARSLLRTEKGEVSEIVVRLRSCADLDQASKDLAAAFGGFKNTRGKPAFEVHTWADLSPFASIANMIDVLIITVKIVMIAIVLISVLNVMLMSVLERIREIGTIAAMGTPPGKILALFVAEGFCLGLLGSVAGIFLGIAGLLAIKTSHVTFSFGRMDNLILRPEINVTELALIAAMVLAASALAALQPAWKASRMEPVDALGHV